MLYYLAITLYIIVCLFLVVVVLIQPGQLGRGGSSFGAGGGALLPDAGFATHRPLPASDRRWTHDGKLRRSGIHRPPE